MTDKIFYKAYRYIGLFLCIWSLSAIVYYVCVKFHLGYWPKYNNPDPANMNSETLIRIGGYILWCYLISMYCSLIYLVLLIFHLIYNRLKKIRIQVKNILISSIGLIVFVVIQILPGTREIITWLLD